MTAHVLANQALHRFLNSDFLRVPLLQKRFIVSAVKTFFVSVTPADTILRIQKIDYFPYRLFPADTQNRFSKIKKKSEPRSGHVGPRSGPACRISSGLC
jgi:hypothetical protein